MKRLTALLPLILLQACSIYDSADRKEFDANPKATQIPVTKSTLVPLTRECQTTTREEARKLAPFQFSDDQPELFINENGDQSVVVTAGVETPYNVEKIDVSLCSLKFRLEDDRDQVFATSRGAVIEFDQQSRQ